MERSRIVPANAAGVNTVGKRVEDRGAEDDEQQQRNHAITYLFKNNCLTEGDIRKICNLLVPTNHDTFSSK